MCIAAYSTDEEERMHTEQLLCGLREVTDAGSCELLTFQSMKGLLVDVADLVALQFQCSHLSQLREGPGAQLSQLVMFQLQGVQVRQTCSRGHVG